MIVGIGVDLANIKRIEDALFRFGDRFLHRILCEDEVAEYAATAQPARFLAKRFAAKEAFSKALGTGIGQDLGWHDLRIDHDIRGKPLILPRGPFAGRMAARSLHAHLSISDEAEHAIAFVILESS
ncbi:MAG TPA: holo-ACP synthase [Usitatibacteraceae bacterium]|nr:holo-ACP synthase [Usitatibacteraceae bacterium]